MATLTRQFIVLSFKSLNCLKFIRPSEWKTYHVNQSVEIVEFKLLTRPKAHPRV